MDNNIAQVNYCKSLKQRDIIAYVRANVSNCKYIVCVCILCMFYMCVFECVSCILRAHSYVNMSICCMMLITSKYATFSQHNH